MSPPQDLTQRSQNIRRATRLRQPAFAEATTGQDERFVRRSLAAVGGGFGGRERQSSEAAEQRREEARENPLRPPRTRRASAGAAGLRALRVKSCSGRIPRACSGY